MCRQDSTKMATGLTLRVSEGMGNAETVPSLTLSPWSGGAGSNG